jgi:uncharacterized membrane protein YobD (UPF0266 family)
MNLKLIIEIIYIINYSEFMKKNNKLLIVLAGLILLVLLYIAFVKTPPSMTINQNVSGISSGFYYGFWFGTALAYTTWANQNYYNHNNHDYNHNQNGSGHSSGSSDYYGSRHEGNGPRR